MVPATSLSVATSSAPPHRWFWHRHLRFRNESDASISLGETSSNIVEAVDVYKTTITSGSGSDSLIFTVFQMQTASSLVAVLTTSTSVALCFLPPSLVALVPTPFSLAVSPWRRRQLGAGVTSSTLDLSSTALPSLAEMVPTPFPSPVYSPLVVLTQEQMPQPLLRC